MRQWIWPEIQDTEDAKKVSHAAAGAALFCAIVTAVVSYLSMQGHALFKGFGVQTFADVIAFFLVAVGLFRMSRIAALVGLVLYVGGQVLMIKQVGLRAPFVTILFSLYFINSVRATFAYHEFRKLEKEEEKKSAARSLTTAASPGPSSAMEAPAAEANRFPVKKLFLPGFMLTVLIAILLIYGPKFLKKNSSSIPAVSSPGVSPAGPSTAPSAPSPRQEAQGQSSTSQRTFHLKSGEVIAGHVVLGDSASYIVEANGGEKLIQKQDIASSD